MAGNSRALPDLVSRIRVDSSGVDAAVASLIGSLGRADLALAGVAAGLGILVVGGKSMYDTWKKIEGSTSSLSQAVSVHNAEMSSGVKKSGELSKAQDALAKAQRQLYEYDLEHHAIAPKTSEDLKGHQRDLAAVETASKELARAQSALEQWDITHTGHVVSAAQLRQREQHLRAVTDAQGKLSAAQSDAASIDTITTRGSQLSAIELARREDLLAKVTDAQGNVNAETDAASRAGANQKMTLDQVRASADKMISTNRRFVSDQSQVYDGYAKLIRGGLSLKETQRVMNDAIDLSTLKHISLSDAVEILSNAEHGRMRGLIDLGITTKGLTDENGDLLGGTRAVAAAMGEVDTAVAKGRDTLAEVDQRTNELKNDWQDLSTKGGPVIETLMDKIVKAATGVYDIFYKIGHDDALWAAISDKLAGLAAGLRHVAINAGIAQPNASDYGGTGTPGTPAYNAENAKEYGMITTGDPTAYLPVGTYETPPYGVDPRNGFAWSRPGYGPGQSHPSSPSGINIKPIVGKAFGGSVAAGRAYSVGEEAEELLVMNAGGGGMVYPKSGGSSRGGRGGDTYNITVNAQTNADPYEMANELGFQVKRLRRRR